MVHRYRLITLTEWMKDLVKEDIVCVLVVLEEAVILSGLKDVPAMLMGQQRLLRKPSAILVFADLQT